MIGAKWANYDSIAARCSFYSHFVLGKSSKCEKERYCYELKHTYLLSDAMPEKKDCRGVAMSAAFSIAQIYNIYFTFVRHRRAEILVYFCVKFTTCHGSYLAVALLRPPDSSYILHYIYRPPDPVWNLLAHR